MTINLKDVKVGGSAQTTAALGATFHIAKAFRLGVDWTLYARNYSDWAFPSTTEIEQNSVKNYESPWRIPSASIFDLNASYRFTIAKCDAVISGNVNNVFDQEYITDANDGVNHDWKTAYGVYYGFGRTFNVRLKINF